LKGSGARSGIEVFNLFRRLDVLMFILIFWFL